MVKYRVHACTDVTGFGPLGHLLEMAQGSDVEIHLDVDGVDFIPEAVELAKMGVLPAGMYRNRSFAESWVDPGALPVWAQDLLYDPQTAGGLAIAVDPADADALLAELKTAVPLRLILCLSYISCFLISVGVVSLPVPRVAAHLFETILCLPA